MKKLAPVLAALIFVSACSGPDRGAEMRLSDAYLSCQQIADEFAELKKLRDKNPAEKENEQVTETEPSDKNVIRKAKDTAKKVNVMVRRFPAAVSGNLKKISALNAAEKREPMLYKLSRIKDCNFTPQ